MNMKESNPQKGRKGFRRLYFALIYSFCGLREGVTEKAFQLEIFSAFFLIPLAFWIGETWVEISLLIASIWMVMIVELLNTGLESAVDRVGSEWHPQSKRCKDVGSAAVLLSIIMMIFIWVSAIYAKI